MVNFSASSAPQSDEAPKRTHAGLARAIAVLATTATVAGLCVLGAGPAQAAATPTTGHHVAGGSSTQGGLDLGAIASLQFVTPPSSVVAGTPTTFGVDALDSLGNVIGLLPSAVLSVNAQASGETIVGSTVTLNKAGARTLTATLGPLTISTPVDVQTGPAATIAFSSAAAATARSGQSVTFSAVASDSFGNAIADSGLAMTIQSSDSTDTIVQSTQTITFGKAGDRTIDFTDGLATIEIHVNVTPGDGDQLVNKSIIPTSVTAGTAIQFQPMLLDAFGIEIPGSSTSITLTTDDPSALVDGSLQSVVFTSAGAHVVTLRAGTMSSSVPVKIKPSKAVVTRMATQPKKYYRGKHYSFAVGSYDQYGNRVSTMHTKVHDSRRSDRKHGASIVFHKAGARIIKVTSGSKHYRLRVVAQHDITKPTVTAPATQTAGTPTSVTVTVPKGASGVAARGIVRLYYGAKHISFRMPASGSKVVKIPALRAGSYPIHLVYAGSLTYKKASTKAQSFIVNTAQ